MAEDEKELNKSDILYELLILSEWVEDYDRVVSKNSLNAAPQESGYFSPWKLLRKSNVDSLRFLKTEHPWHLACSKDGKVLAVLQETLLEIKTAKDEYSSTVGKASIPIDQCPKLRKLQWSHDNSFLAVARDNGTVYVFNLFGCNLATIKPDENGNGVLQPVVGLGFLQPKFKSTKWSNELVIVYQKGTVKSVLLSSLDGQESEENINFSLGTYYPQGVSSVAFDMNSLLIVAGPPAKNESGISVWRILNDYPYLKCAFDIEKFQTGSRSFLRFLPGFSNSCHPNTVFKMSVSPNNKSLACLHFSGKISLWRLPGVVLEKEWNLHDQPQFDRWNPESGDVARAEYLLHPADIGWWSNNAVVVARRNGAITVCSTSDLKNLLGESPEYLAGCPQVSCIEGPRSGVIALECETYNHNRRLETQVADDIIDGETSILQESIQAAIYSFTDIERFEPKRKTLKVTQRTYRIIAIKRTTPEELYNRKIDNEEYEEALLLAQKYNLDCDLVYQKRWRNSNASVDCIHDYLEKVNKVQWVVKECVERVPDTLDDAKELLKFGLKKTDLNISPKKLTAETKQLLLYRKQLLKFSDNLTIYEKIIGSPVLYNSVEYDDFRKRAAIVATANFARQENWQAVSIMFTYAGDSVLPHWLPILSNFPETLRPLQYRSLLPEIVDDQVIPWQTKKLRESDWSEKPQFRSLEPTEDGDEHSDDILYKTNPHLKQFRSESVTADTVREWYRERCYEIERSTGLVECALNFVVLARERGVQTLERLHSDLLTLESMVYLVGDENVSLKKLESLNHFEQCKLLLSRTVSDTFIVDLKNLIVPFSRRCERQGCHTGQALLRDVLLYLSEESLGFALGLLNHLKEGYLNPFELSLNETVSIVLDCIYSCKKSDQLETCFLILECLPERSKSLSREDEKLHDRIDEVEVYLEVCDILSRYQIHRTVYFIRDSENDDEIGKELMANMADYCKSEILDFTELLSDFQTICSKIFQNIPETYCYELCTLSQMTCECEEIILSAEDVLECRRGEKDKVIPYERSVQLILEAARTHFEKAINFDDHYIELAQTCLRLVGEPDLEICEELDLIEAIQLLGDFDVNMLPLQVRKHENRLKLIEACLKARPTNYKSYQRLLQLAHSLRIYGDDRIRREGEILMMIAEYALKSSDYAYCSEICNRLMSKNFTAAWTVVTDLARHEGFEDRADKQSLLAFAILHCPIEKAEELIECRVQLRDKYFGSAITSN